MTGMETKRARGKCTANTLVCQLCWTFLFTLILVSATKTDAAVLQSQWGPVERGIALCGRLWCMRHSASDRSVYMLILTKPQRTAADALLHITSVPNRISSALCHGVSPLQCRCWPASVLRPFQGTWPGTIVIHSSPDESPMQNFMQFERSGRFSLLHWSVLCLQWCNVRGGYRQQLYFLYSIVAKRRERSRQNARYKLKARLDTFCHRFNKR